ncbi:MAG: hypothetical protein LBU23_05080, partial [Planctomycetota bacterium]|nr:hypothetical protein [Planctomycetota bacterium]
MENPGSTLRAESPGTRTSCEKAAPAGRSGFPDGPSPRVLRLKESFLSRQPRMCCDRALIYTEVYQNCENLPVVLKRAAALRETLVRMPIFIEPEEVIMGHFASRPRAAEVFPEVNMAFMEEIDH